ncbi:MAG: trypsin-like peptidase domain-containing protein [Algicola sp.]|nr:trypsin-like peptidase domain-containing protein [Algicola sp.]
MTDISEIIKAHSVVVDGGSGVLMQPMTADYSYVLTAAHNLRVDSEDTNSALKEANDIELYTFNAQSDAPDLVALALYKHDTLDIAIIQIALYPALSIGLYQKKIMLDDHVRLYGYPGKRRHVGKPVNEWLNNHSLVVQDRNETLFTLRNKVYATIDDIKGFSGGGIFHINEAQDQAFLVGIECSMEDVREEHDRLAATPVTQVNQIIQQHSLAPLKPLHLGDFALLTDKVFPEAYYEHLAQFKWSNFIHVVDILKELVNKIAIEIAISPNDILENNLPHFKVGARGLSTLEDTKLWSSMLELLAIITIVESNDLTGIASSLDITRMLESFRFVYIDTDKNWEAHYEEIVTVNTDHLNENGKIILILGRQRISPATIDQDAITEAIENISRPTTGEFIDNAIRISENRYPVIHWLSLHDQCIFQQADSFKEFSSIFRKSKNVELLKQNYMPHLASVNN